MTMLELLEESPIIAAIKSWEGLEKSLKSECKCFAPCLARSAIDQVRRIKDAGKVAIVHVDMIQGLSTKRVAVDFIAHNTRADGNISTKIHWWSARRRWDFMRSREPLCGFDRNRYIGKTDRNVSTGCSRDHAGGDAEDS